MSLGEKYGLAAWMTAGIQPLKTDASSRLVSPDHEMKIFKEAPLGPMPDPQVI